MKKFRTGDTVQIMRGKESGKKGKIVLILDTKTKRGKDITKVVVEGVNIVKRSQKPNPTLGITGGIIEVERPISISNVMYYDEELGRPVRLGFKKDEKTGKKTRFIKKNDKSIK